MRIIAGEHGGRSLQAPAGRGTRPMIARAREALFSTLGERVVDARVLDLYAGTGSLGLEALSRGAEAARMVERDRNALKALEANIEALRVEDRAEVRRGNALDPSHWETWEPAIVLFDPPYPLWKDRKARGQLLETIRSLTLEHKAFMVFHIPRRELDAEELGEGLDLDRRSYGTSEIWYAERAS